MDYTSKLSIDKMGREPQERMTVGDIAARRHNGLPLIVGVVRSLNAESRERHAMEQALRTERVARYRAIVEQGGRLFEDN